MVLIGDGGRPNLYTIGAQGQNKPAPLTTTQDAKSSPCYSPDGRRIVFAMEPGPQLYLINATGGAPERLRTGQNYAAEPDWSRAKPNLIAFTTTQGPFRVAVHDMATGKTRVIAPRDASGAALGGDFIEPSWLPDGRHIVCTHRTPNARSLYILDTEENSNNRATKISSGYAERPSVWAP
jgi:TolB protein